MARKKRSQIGPHIEQRHNRYYAVMKVPEDVQGVLKRKRFAQTLGTDSAAEARRRAPAVIAGWKSQIEAARQGSADPIEADADYFRRLYQRAKSPRERAAALEAIETEADWFAAAESNPREDEYSPEGVATAQRFYGLATGTIVKTDAHLDDWLKGLPDEKKTKDLKRLDVRRLAERFPTLPDITRKEVQKFCQELMNEKGLARATVARGLSTYRRYWAYLQALEVVPDDLMPFNGLALPAPSKKETAAKERQPFTPKDVVRLLWEAEARKDPELADLIRLGMWTGARLEELCSLTVERVNLKAGYIEIADAKTPAGWRQVPVHEELRETLARLCKDRTEGYALTNLTTNKYGDRSNAIGKRFGRLKRDLGFGPSHVFHSIRRTVVTILENAGIPENVVADIVGHEKTTMTYGLYSGGSSLKVKAKAIKKLSYPGYPKQ